MDRAATDERFHAAVRAIERRAWPEAFELLTAADADGVLDAEGLAALGKAAYWDGRAHEAIEANERAYAAFVGAGDHDRAAFVALTLRRLHVQRLAASAATGWLARAETLLGDRPDSIAMGFLTIARSEIAWNRGDLDEALEHLERALRIAGVVGDRDLLAWAVMRKGMVLVAMGRLDEGWSLMEEVSAAAAGNELGVYTTGAVFCNVVTMCRDMADYARAREWSDAAKRWCARQSITGFPGVCRVHRAEVMRLIGAWGEAEEEVRRATVELLDFSPAYAGMAFHELGEVRLRMGELEDARAAFAQAHELGEDPQPGLALLLLAEGKADAAAASIDRSLEETEWDRLARARLLPAKAEIAIARGDPSSALAAADELDEIAAGVGTTAIRASADWAHGLADLASHHAADAVRHLRRARQRWQEIDAPYEAARCGVALADAHVAEGDADAAEMELRSARAVFDRLGAAADERTIAGRLASLQTADRHEVARRTFVFTDIVASTALLEAIGDEAWSDLRRWHDEALRRCFADRGGEEVDHTGDGFFVAFADARSAVDCAREIQRALAEHRRQHGFAPQVRIGLHLAEATRAPEGYAGKGVHAAARIAVLAGGGEIVASAATLEGLEDLTTTDRRSMPLKGLAEPVEVVTIGWR